MEDNSNAILDETTSEFHNIKGQFEEFGNNLYERISGEFQKKLTYEINKASEELFSTIRDETNEILLDSLK